MSLPKKKNSKQQISLSRQELVYESSPFIPAKEAAEYEKLCPGFSKELMEEFKKESSHRRELEKIANTTHSEIAKIRSSKEPLTIVCCFILAAIILFIAWQGFKLQMGWESVGLVGCIGSIVLAFWGLKPKKD